MATYEHAECEVDFPVYASDAASAFASTAEMYTGTPVFGFKLVRPKFLFRELVSEVTEATEEWFNEEGWLKGEAEADEDLAHGRCHDFENVNEAIAFLRSQR